MGSAAGSTGVNELADWDGRPRAGLRRVSVLLPRRRPTFHSFSTKIAVLKTRTGRQWEVGSRVRKAKNKRRRVRAAHNLHAAGR